MKTKKFLFYLLSVILTGCVPSLHELFSDKNRVSVDTLLGTWTSNNQTETWELKRYSDDKDKRYRLIHIDREKGKRGRFLTTFGKLNNILFVDLLPEYIESDTSYFHQRLQLSAHTFAKIEQTNSELKVTMMDPDKVKTLLQNEPNLIKHEVLKDQDSTIVLTASTEGLQKFVAKYANDPNVFGCQTILTRKAKEPNEPNK